MKERPILFSGEMVRAILDGRKTMTRRVIKPQPRLNDAGLLAWKTSGCLQNIGRSAEEMLIGHCPYGQPGDLLWVRETWASLDGVDHLSPKDIELLCRDAGYKTGPCGDLWYQADNSYRQWGDDKQTKGKWRPSIHMPRWASRINLEVVSVRVERVQDITEEDAIAEGSQYFLTSGKMKRNEMSMRSAFANLWDSINLKRGYGWDSNPWVWVVEFKRLP